jgi:GNAT superfamily N-acetyltransferase
MLSPPVLAVAVEANINAQLPLIYAQMPGVEVIDEPDLLGMMAGWPDPLINSVYWAAFPPEQAEARIDEVLGRFRSRGHLPVSWIISPDTRPRDLGCYLEARGFALASRGLGMAADLDAVAASRPTPTGLVIERVSSVEGLKRWLHPVKVCFELGDATASAFFDLFASGGFGPDVPWTLLVGLADGHPVSASRLFCAAGVAGIYHVATLPEARGRGFGTAKVLAAVRAGRELGYRAGILTASGEGHSLYERLGFEDCCQAGIYLGPMHQLETGPLS